MDALERAARAISALDGVDAWQNGNGLDADLWRAEKTAEAQAALEAVGFFSLERELAEAREALGPLARAAAVLDMPNVDGGPFDDPKEVLWAGETGLITVEDFRRAARVHQSLSTAPGSHAGDQRDDELDR